MSTKDRLEKAKALIQAKRYDEARVALKYINHPTARKWMAKLERMDIPEKVVDAPAPPPTHPQPKRRLSPLVILTLIVVGLLVAGWAYREIKLNDDANYIRGNASASLTLFCDFGTRLGRVRCEEYAKRTLDSNRQFIFDAVFCGDLYNPISSVESFGSCLVRRGIPLPG